MDIEHRSIVTTASLARINSRLGHRSSNNSDLSKHRMSSRVTDEIHTSSPSASHPTYPSKLVSLKCRFLANFLLLVAILPEIASSSSILLLEFQGPATMTTTTTIQRLISRTNMTSPLKEVAATTADGRLTGTNSLISSNLVVIGQAGGRGMKFAEVPIQSVDCSSPLSNIHNQLQASCSNLTKPVPTKTTPTSRTPSDLMTTVTRRVNKRKITSWHGSELRANRIRRQIDQTNKLAGSKSSSFASPFSAPLLSYSGLEPGQTSPLTFASASDSASASASGDSNSGPVSASDLSLALSEHKVKATDEQKPLKPDRAQQLKDLEKKYKTNRVISDKAYYSLLVIYSLFIFVGTISNSLICLTVILRPRILSPRNIFIINLAASDLLLCVFTMPFSFIELSTKIWPMGELPCKLVASLQGTSIFVSTISITAIALDRYKVIVYPTHPGSSSGLLNAFLWLVVVWCFALTLSLPLFYFRQLEQLPDEFSAILSSQKNTRMCMEIWPYEHGRGIYSVISMIVQYLVPITVVSVVYARISDKLQKRLVRRQKLTQLEWQHKRQLHLIRKTHTMLIIVSLIFGLCWLPLNLLNIISDFSGDLLTDSDFRIAFAVCHLIGCSSACSNPILYGYMNENFRKELQQVYIHYWHYWCRLTPECLRLRTSRQTSLTQISFSSEPLSTSTSSSSQSGECQSSGCGTGSTSRQMEHDNHILIMMTQNPNATRCSSQGQPSSILGEAGDDLLASKSALSGQALEASAKSSKCRDPRFLVRLSRIFACSISSSYSTIDRVDSQRVASEPASRADRSKVDKEVAMRRLKDRGCSRAKKRKDKSDQRADNRRCPCYCHLSSADDVNAIKRTSSTGARPNCAAPKKSHQIELARRRLSSGDMTLAGRSLVLSEAIAESSNSHAVQKGRKVWLRFFPSKQRYNLRHSQQEANRKTDKGRRHCTICRADAERRRKERRERRRLKEESKKLGDGARFGNISNSVGNKQASAGLTEKSSTGQQETKLDQPMHSNPIDHLNATKRLGSECMSKSTLIITMRAGSESLAEQAQAKSNSNGDKLRKAETLATAKACEPAKANNQQRNTPNIAAQNCRVGFGCSRPNSEESKPSEPASPTSVLSSMYLNSSNSSQSVCSCIRDSSLICEDEPASNSMLSYKHKQTSAGGCSIGADKEVATKGNGQVVSSTRARRRCYTIGSKGDTVESQTVGTTNERCCQARSMASANCCFGSTISSITTATDIQSSEFICSSASVSRSTSISESASDSSLPIRDPVASVNSVIQVSNKLERQEQAPAVDLASQHFTSTVASAELASQPEAAHTD